jgi:hypothetical protein
MPNAEIRAVVEWLIDGARSAPLQQILAQLCDRLVACGIPLWRVAVLVRTLHPNVMGRRFVWRPDAEVEVREAPFELLETSDSLDSMIAHVYLTADPVRRRLAVPHPSSIFRSSRNCAPRAAECRWICGRSASPTGCAFAHIPTGTNANQRIDIDEGEGRSNVITIAPSAIGAGTEIGRATP